MKRGTTDVSSNAKCADCGASLESVSVGAKCPNCGSSNRAHQLRIADSVGVEDDLVSHVRRRVSEGESASLELKSKIPRADALSAEIAALANSGGGELILGVDEPANFVGIDGSRVGPVVESALESLAPRPPVSLRLVELDGREVALITVEGALVPVGSARGYYQRVGDRMVPMTGDEISRQVRQHQPLERAVDQLSKTVSDQTQTIEHLRRDFNVANSMKRKLAIAAVGAVIGAVLKVVIGALVGG